MSGGPLAGLRIVEIAALGPAPFAAMMLADHGAEVIRIERPAEARAATPASRAADILSRSRESVALDLKLEADRAALLALVREADAMLEGFRPGVMERLGLGPEEVQRLNPRLVYGRMTGWGQDGPLAQAAGHDINYLAVNGILEAIGRPGERPHAPLNLVADFGGGGMMMAFAMLAALLHARATGEGQVVDGAMIEGSSLLMAVIWSLKAQGYWRGGRGTNLLDGGAPFYDTYEAADGRFVALGAIEPQFYAEMLARLGLAEDAAFAVQMDSRAWPLMRARLAALFRTKTRDEWGRVFDGADACFSPVLSAEEALANPHVAARAMFATVDGVVQPAPAPRYARTPLPAPGVARAAGRTAAEITEQWRAGRACR